MRFDVRFYDDEEQTQLEKSKEIDGLRKVVDQGLDLDSDAFLAASMFQEQKQEAKWRTREDLRSRAAGRRAEFEDYFDATVTLNARFSPEDMDTRTERAGVAAAICTMDKAFDTHLADWEKIPEKDEKGHAHKDLDFWVAAAGDRVIAVEAKGSVVADVSKKSTSISAHKKDIKEKKAAQKTKREGQTLIGAILAIPRSEGMNARVWLLDPTVETLGLEPDDFKVLARYRFYAAMIRLIGEPQLLGVLVNRITALERVSRVGELDGVALTRPNGLPFGIPPSFQSPPRARSRDGKLVGYLTWSKNSLVFTGLHVGVIDALITQSHAAIRKWSIPPRRAIVVFLLTLTRDEAVRLGLVFPSVGVSRWEFEVAMSCWRDRSGVVIASRNF